jgi:hypothetical protein
MARTKINKGSLYPIQLNEVSYEFIQITVKEKTFLNHSKIWFKMFTRIFLTLLLLQLTTQVNKIHLCTYFHYHSVKEKEHINYNQLKNFDAANLINVVMVEI